MTVVLSTVSELRSALAGERVALVPTMGALHEGHLSLVERARTLADRVVVSIFVNPMQFAAGEDFDRYPRDFASDLRALEAAGVDWVFAPEPAELYPDAPHTTVETRLHAGTAAELWEGAARPGHFDGVLTVVLKLLNSVQPAVAVFGEKDAQQLALIRQMVADLNLPVHIESAPVSREADGLARSSRNIYLTPEQRAAAPSISAALHQAAQAVATGQPVAEAIAGAEQSIRATGVLEPEYLALVHPVRFTALNAPVEGALFITAVRAGQTRLLDTVRLG